MKKTLAAVAVLGAFAGSALAADVTLYGVVDFGLGYSHVDDNGTKTDNWGLKSGQDSMSRIGFKGTEQISEGLTVGFNLETGFDADTGKNKATNPFHRESRLFIQTDFGEIGMGRFGSLDSTTGAYNLAGSSLHATTGVGGIGDTGPIFLGQGDRMNNSIAYVSPKFGGFQVRAMASLGSDTTYVEKKESAGVAAVSGKEATHKVDRYYALGATYDVGALHTALIVSQMDRADVYSDKEIDDALTVTAGASYDFGVTKAFVAGQYYDNAQATAAYDSDMNKWKDTEFGMKGYGVTVGAKTPVLGGVLTTQVGYADAEDVNDSKVEYSAYSVGALYHYGLSKRTTVYGGVGYLYQEDKDHGTSEEVKTINAAVGLVHKF